MNQNKSLGRSVFTLFRACVSLATALLISLSAGLAADDSKLRYVSGEGADSGDCLNVFRPCRTLTYAIAQAGKGDWIVAAAGEYPVSSTDDLHTLIGALGRLKGGMDRLSDFKVQDAVNNVSTLTGIPPEYRELFQQAGFRVIADSKGTGGEEAARMQALSKQLFAVRKSHGRTDCAGGLAGQFPCQNINLHSHLSFSELDKVSVAASDIWGFVDLNTHREYAIIGLSDGAAFVDVTEPGNPFVVGTHSGLSSTWRDIKVHQIYDADAGRWRAYAYISTEAPMDLVIFDLSQLPNNIERVPHTSDHKSAHNVYIANTDYTFGTALPGDEPVLAVAGADTGGGRYRLYSLNNPEAPELLSLSNRGYMHDAASISITDSRKDTQCTVATALPHCEVLADFNEETVDIWEISDPANPTVLSSFTYPNATYVHSGWWTEDGRYLLVHDELDESDRGINTTVRVFDMNDLANPESAGTWVGPNRAIDHNGFARGNRYYISNYAEGLTVLDISDPTSPTHVGRFDTMPSSAGTGFVGAWGVYPFLPSGTVIVSDINSGLYVLEDNSRQSASGGFAFSSANYSGVEGDSLSVRVDRVDGATNSVSVTLELLYLNTESGDTGLDTTTLNWTDGDTGSKTVNLQLIGDSEIETVERLALRLISPTDGAVLGVPNVAHVYVSDPSAATELNLLATSGEIREQTGNAFITVNRDGSVEGAVSVSYRTLGENEGEAFEPVNGTLTWEDGEAQAKTVAIPLLQDADVDSDQTMQVEIHSPVGATLGENAVATFTVKDTGTTPAPNGGGNAGGVSGGGGSGGGNLGWLGLFLMGCLCLYRATTSNYRK